MSAQRNDRQVARDAAVYNQRIHELRSFLRRCGIRNVSTSPKAKQAIHIASVSKMGRGA